MVLLGRNRLRTYLVAVLCHFKLKTLGVQNKTMRIILVWGKLYFAHVQMKSIVLVLCWIFTFFLELCKIGFIFLSIDRFFKKIMNINRLWILRRNDLWVILSDISHVIVSIKIVSGLLYEIPGSNGLRMIHSIFIGIVIKGRIHHTMLLLLVIEILRTQVHLFYYLFV